MPLESYRKKRKFDETPEPAGRLRRSRQERIFVVQKHYASHLHYDFRLEINGVLISWAVPKGPSLDPSTKRFATMTEDHPVEYADFEGVIPQGHYGAGTVMVWDKGTYEPEGDVAPEERLGHGELKVVLQGKKLRGAFVLFHIGRHAGRPREKSRWLLIKRRDQWADSKWKADDPAADRSVLSGRTLEEIEHPRPARKRPRESNRSNVKLRSVLRRRLAGWRDDLPASWRAAVEGVELDFEHRTFDGEAHRGLCSQWCRMAGFGARLEARHTGSRVSAWTLRSSPRRRRAAA